MYKCVHMHVHVCVHVCLSEGRRGMRGEPAVTSHRGMSEKEDR